MEETMRPFTMRPMRATVVAFGVACAIAFAGAAFASTVAQESTFTGTHMAGGVQVASGYGHSPYSSNASFGHSPYASRFSSSSRYPSFGHSSFGRSSFGYPPRTTHFSRSRFNSTHRGFGSAHPSFGFGRSSFYGSQPYGFRSGGHSGGSFHGGGSPYYAPSRFSHGGGFRN